MDILTNVGSNNKEERHSQTLGSCHNVDLGLVEKKVFVCLKGGGVGEGGGDGDDDGICPHTLEGRDEDLVVLGQLVR